MIATVDGTSVEFYRATEYVVEKLESFYKGALI